MNLTLLRQTRRILATKNLPADTERALLTRLFALAWAASATKHPMQQVQEALAPFLPPNHSVPPDMRRKLENLLAHVPAQTEGTPNAFTPEILALLHEHTTPNARAKGVFYTPWPAAKRLAAETLDEISPQGRAIPAGFTACDPAAGAGGLLIPLWLEMAARLEKMRPTAKKSAILKTCAAQLYAGDLDASALNTLRLRAALTFYAKTNEKPPQTLFSNLLAGDALAGRKTSVWQEKFPRVFSAGGFDAVLCNPPYVGQKNHKEIFERLRRQPRWQPYVSPKGDLLYLFFHLALELLKPGGVGGFLTTTYFAQAASAAALRKRLQAETAFLRLIDFNAQRLFSRAPGQHNLISIFQKTADKSARCRVGDTLFTQAELYAGSACFLHITPRDGLTASLLSKMAAAPLRLKNAARISNGLMTGCDKISAAHLSRHPLPGTNKGAGVFVLSQEEKEALNLSEAEQTKLKPFFKNSDIFPYTTRTAPVSWLIDFFYPNDRETDFSLYPHLMAHLARFKPVLLARKQNNNGIDKQLKKGIFWFGSVRRKMDFDAPKLAAPQRARTNTFAFAPGPWYASSDVYFISAPKQGFSLWYLLALLNSAPYYTWLFYKGKRKGNLLELYSQPLAEMPLPAAEAKTRRQLETLARQIYQTKLKKPAADTAALQAQIDRLAGGLFGLTKAEIRHAQAQQAAAAE